MFEAISTAPSTQQDANWTVQEAYNIYNAAYNGQGLARFIDVAEAVLETHIHSLDRIRLLALLGTAVADPRETADFYTQAESQWQVAKLYQNLMQGETEAKMHELRVLIDRLGDVVHREHQAANMSEGEEDIESDENEEVDTNEQMGVSTKPIPSRALRSSRQATNLIATSIVPRRIPLQNKRWSYG